MKFILSTCLLLLSAGAYASTPVPTTVKTQQGLTLKAWYWAPDTTTLAGPAVVLMHGCSGVYSNSSPNASYSNLQFLFTDWGKRLSAAGYSVMLVDSYTGRGAPQNQCGNGVSGTNEVADRPYDALAAYDALIKTSAYQVGSGRVAILGWSQGASATVSAMDISTWPMVFNRAVAMYPGCGLYNAYGGISASTYAPYSPLHIMLGTLDPFYTSGYCQTRQQRAVMLGSGEFKPIWSYTGAAHSFDYCTQTSSSCSSADVQAKIAADKYVMQVLQGL